MYFTTLPDHTAPGFDEQAHFNRFSRHNILFNARSSGGGCDDHVGCLSLKTVGEGEEWYRVGRSDLALRPGQFLILNEDQRYGCRIEPGTPTRVQSIFFKKDFAAAVLNDLRKTERSSLDEPDATGSPAAGFFTTLQPLDRGLTHLMSSLFARLGSEGDNDAMTDEYLVSLLRYLFHTLQAERIRAARVEAMRPATRFELLKRLHLAKDLMQSFYKEELDLGSIARGACLSVPQLVRQFKAVYGQTPHRYLTGIRLSHAADSLRRTQTPVRELTWLCGFNDPSAFCRAFRAAYGLSPDHYRALHR